MRQLPQCEACRKLLTPGRGVTGFRIVITGFRENRLGFLKGFLGTGLVCEGFLNWVPDLKKRPFCLAVDARVYEVDWKVHCTCFG